MMADIVPLHSVVFCDRDQLAQFPPHERLSQQSVLRDLVGDTTRDLRAIVVAELLHRVSLKLSLGQRVAVLDDLTAADHRQLTSLATAQGASVVKAVAPLALAQALPAAPYGHLRGIWKGITLVGDVHGELAALTAALQWAKARQHFVWLLGDVIDYGADTLETADAVHRAVMSGCAAVLIGNHERKIARWLYQSENGKPHIRINDGNRVTIDALNRLKPPARKQWIGRFRALLGHASLMQQIDNLTLLHAAAHPSLWEAKPNPTLVEQFALYGEGDHSGGKFRRVHHWIDAVPLGKTVFVGHDVLAPFPTILTGAKGGQVVFLDTGCGTGGFLSTADLRFNDAGLRLECFNRH